MAGLQPQGPQYGDVSAMREMGVKYSPETSTPTFFNPKGGRPPGATQAPALGGGPAPVAPPQEAGIPAEHQDLFQRAHDLAEAALAWQSVASRPGASEKMKLIALAVKGAAKIAVINAREGTPFTREP